VIAVESVHALVVRDTDFVNFLDAHPRANAIVRAQLNDRYIEDRTWSAPDGRDGSFDAGTTPDGRASFASFSSAGPAAPRPQAWNGENCTIILSDVVGFGAHYRTDDHRRVIRESLWDMTRTSLRGLGGVCSWEDRGDGLLTIVPPNVPTSLVITHLYKELPAAIEEHNRTHDVPARIRLRVAVNVGPVTTDTVGVSGEAIIVTARMVEAPTFKDEMEKSQAGDHRFVVYLRFDDQARPEPVGIRSGPGQAQGSPFPGLDETLRPTRRPGAPRPGLAPVNRQRAAVPAWPGLSGDWARRWCRGPRAGSASAAGRPGSPGGPLRGRPWP
jgi:hypothetical protein